MKPNSATITDVAAQLVAELLSRGQHESIRAALERAKAPWQRPKNDSVGREHELTPHELDARAILAPLMAIAKALPLHRSHAMAIDNALAILAARSQSRVEPTDRPDDEIRKINPYQLNIMQWRQLKDYLQRHGKIDT